MAKESPVLVLASGDDPQFAMLNELSTTHSMWGGCRVCPSRERCDGNLAMVRDTRVAARIVWDLREGALDTPRAAGLDNLLFPELVESLNSLDQRTRRLSASLGEFVRWQIFCISCEGFPADGSQPNGICLGAVRRARDRWTNGWDFEGGDIGRAVASRVHAMSMRVLATKRAFSRIDGSARGSLLQAGGTAGDYLRFRLHCGDGPID